MFKKSLFDELLLLPIKVLFSSKQFPINNIKQRNSFLLTWSNDQFGLLLSSRLVIKSLKNCIPDSKVTLRIKEKYIPFLKQKKISDLFGLSENDQIISANRIINIISENFDIAIIPSIKDFAFNDHIFAKLNGVKGTIGISDIDGMTNPYRFLLNEGVNINWKKYPDMHFSEILMKLFERAGINEFLPFSEMLFLKFSSEHKIKTINKYGISPDQRIIGLYFESDSFTNRWDFDKVYSFLLSLKEVVDCHFYFFIDKMDENIIQIRNKLNQNITIVKNEDYFETIKLISFSDLFITNNKEYMHLAGITEVPQITLFGSSNPFRWAPLGENKKFIRISDFVNDISSDEVLELARSLLNIN